MSCAHRRPAARSLRVSAFTSANIDKILALKPNLVLTFSDLQADIVADLIRRGLEGWGLVRELSNRMRDPAPDGRALAVPEAKEEDALTPNASWPGAL
jgi:hypothetical protein